MEKVVFTNMCMIYDNKGNVLVQNRLNPKWSGIAFPGGHVDEGESFIKSVIREVKEETGYDVFDIKFCGIKHFFIDNNVRYVIFLYKTNKFKGVLKSSEEGEVFWIKAKDLDNYSLAKDFKILYQVFIDDNICECTYGKKEVLIF